MKNNFVTILDFGSSKVTCMTAYQVAENGEFVIKAVGQSSYNGFDNNNWYEPETIKDTIVSAIKQVETKMQTTIKEVFVGVPGAFSAVLTSEASLTFQSKKKIDNDDIAELIRKADIFKCGNDYIQLDGKPVYFVLDGAIKTLNPVGSIANKITALVSFSYMRNYFRNSVAQVLADCGVNKITYVNTCQAQASYINESMNNDGYCIVIDVGHITSNVVLCGGDGAIFTKTFALGSGYLASDLRQIVGCDFATAMSVLERVNLNLDIKMGDAYSVNGKMIDASQTNDVIRARIGQIAEYVIKSFAYCDKEIPKNTPIILTGGGLSYLRGGIDCLATHLGKQVRLYDSMNPQTNRNEYTSCYGLISQALKMGSKKNKLLSIFGRIAKRR